jgi:hypothetical protein
MRVNIFHIDQRTDKAHVEVQDVDLVESLGDFPEDAPGIAEEIERKGLAVIGGGAQPLFRFEKAAPGQSD